MKFGLSIAFSDPSDYCTLAQAADENGFSAVSVADHLIYPRTFSVPYPYTDDGVPRFGEMDHFPDPWVAITAMAGVTQNVSFYTNVFVLPTRNPFHVAKQLSTADVFTGGRVALGVGMGWMPEEFNVSGQSFGRRGKRADEMIEVLRLLWSGEMVEYHGEFYDFEPARMLPTPLTNIPIYVGGFSKPALRRAARNDGWIADLHTLSELEALCREVDDYRVAAGTADQAFEKCAFGCVDAVDVSGYRAMADMGVTVASTMPCALYGHGHSPELRVAVDSVKRFSDEVISKL